jgi:large repetitive protein
MAFSLVLLPSSPAAAATQGISGQVTGPSGTPLPGVDVWFFIDTGDGHFAPYDYATTDALGNYAEQLPASTFQVAFADPDGGFISEYYDDAPTSETAETVTVTTSHVTAAINAQLAAGGHITGHAAGGAGGWVEGWTESSPGAGDWQPSYETWVDPTGDYDLGGLPSGNYRVQFRVEDFAPEFWKDEADVTSATPIAVAAPDTVSGIDPTLTPNGHITGHVEDGNGAAIADAEVDAYTLDGSEWEQDWEGWAVTDADGDYDLSLPPGNYRIGFVAGGFADEFYDDVRSVEDGTSIPVASGATATGKDAVLEQGASISGTVTLPAGVDPYASEDGVVTAVDTATNKRVGLTWVDADSSTGDTYPYTLNGLPQGSYRVEFAHLDGPATSEAQFFQDHPESAGAASADAVTLTPGQQETGVDATLRAGGTISGTLVDGNGDPLEGCDVVAFNSVHHLVRRVGTTGADGTFQVTGLTTDQYGVAVGDPYGVGNPCAVTEYYTNTSGDLSESSAGIVPVAAAPGSDTALPHDLVYGGSATKSVTNTTAPTVPAAAPVVGSPVTANPGTWDPSDATLAYQWKADGAPISGATSASYTPVTADVGKKLSVTVTASKEDYTSTSKDSNQTAAVVGTGQTVTMASTSPPSVAGIPRVGQQLTADAGSWYPTGPTTAVQWLRNGVPVAGATGSTYALGADDVGARISVRVTATRDGYQPATTTSAATTPILAGIITLTDVPHLLGRLKVGKVLSAVPPTCTPGATSVRYQWLRNGVAIKGPAARRARYKLVRADRGKKISVRITVLRAGYTPTASVAKRAGKVR